MPRLIPLAKLRAPLGGQEIELQQVDHEAGGMSLLRTRIREGSRFTVFDIDPHTAAAWGEALQRWAADDLRSLNAQVEFLLRRALQSAGRVKSPADTQKGHRETGGPES